MAIEAPTASAFKTRYPGFASVADTLVDAVIAEAVAGIDAPHWIETDVQVARMLYVAHTLTVDGEPMRSAAASAGTLTPSVAAASGVRKLQVGDVSVEFDSATAAKMSALTGTTLGGLDATQYGRRLLELQRENFGGPRVA